MKLLDEAIEIFGSAAELARAAGVSQQVINNAARRGSVSPELADAIDVATTKAGKRIARERLVWGDYKPGRKVA